MISNLINISLILISALLIILVLLQGGRSESSGSLIGKNSLALYAKKKERGYDKWIVCATAVVGIVFSALVVVANFVL